MAKGKTMGKCSALARWLVVSAGLMAVAACSDLPGTGTPGSEAARLGLLNTSEVIALVPGAERGAILKSRAPAQGYKLLEETDLTGLDLVMLRFALPSGVTGKEAIDALEALDAASTVGVNHVYTVAAPGVPEQLDYARSLIRWPGAACRAQVAIGMLDTGVDPAALVSAGGRVETRSFQRGDPVSPRHGNDVASVLLDPDMIRGARLYSAAVVARTPDGREATGVDSIIKALDWMSSEGVRLVNISLTGPYNKLLDRSVARAAADGMVIVAAVGNDGARAEPRYPAALDPVIAVTAVDAEGEIFRNAVRGAYVDLAAPGVDVPAAHSGAVRLVTGTSMAAPFVTARIAADPGLATLGAAAVRARLSQSAMDIGPAGADTTYGFGLIQAPASCPS